MRMNVKRYIKSCFEGLSRGGDKSMPASQLKSLGASCVVWIKSIYVYTYAKQIYIHINIYMYKVRLLSI